MRCILKVEAAGFADGLDLGAEGERIIKIDPTINHVLLFFFNYRELGHILVQYSIE